MAEHVNLTAAQARLLFDLSMMSETVDEAYEPALALVREKLAKKRKTPGRLIRVTITDAGRAHPAANTLDLTQSPTDPASGEA